MDRNAKIKRLYNILPSDRNRTKYLQSKYVMNTLVTMPPEKYHTMMMKNYRGVEGLWAEVDEVIDESGENDFTNEYTGPTGGKRRTHKRRTHKHRTHKRRTHKRRH